MMNCWKSEPEARPSFNDLTQQLKRMENQHKVRLSGKQLKKECFLFITQEKTGPSRCPSFIKRRNHSNALKISASFIT